MNREAILITFLSAFSLIYTPECRAQITKDIYQSDNKIDSEEKGKLYINVDNVSFLKNNEYKGNFIKGYTLPGFRIRSTAVYYPLKNIKLEGGVHGLRFWGAEKYPNFAYSDIPTWKGSQFQHGLHVVPFFVAQFELSKHWQVTIGNIYGGANHKLIEPLYNPEMNLVADPESGIQILYDSRKWDMDIWLNWESFIFDSDTHSEAFTVGISSRFKYNDPQSKVHIYSPLQILGQHRGGEIDVSDHKVQMLFNAAAGVNAVWNINCRKSSSIEAGINVASFYRQSGDLTPFKNGYGVYAHASANISALKLKTSYWVCKNFVTAFGNPMYGSISVSRDGFYFDKPRMAYLGAGYCRKFGKGFALGADLDVYYHFSVDTKSPEGVHRQKSAAGFSFGAYCRVNPSFFIKKF